MGYIESNKSKNKCAPLGDFIDPSSHMNKQKQFHLYS